jgi:hypothetical protein
MGPGVLTWFHDAFYIYCNGKWVEEDFKLLIDKFASKRGYGWVRPEGIRKELENYKGV